MTDHAFVIPFQGHVFVMPGAGVYVPSDPSAGFELYLAYSADPFLGRVGATTYSDPTTLPGYAYTRTGAKGEVNDLSVPADVIDDFAANVPAIIPGVGYWSRGALTNEVIQSQNLTTGWLAEQLTVIANDIAAPDGTTTADKLTMAAANAEHRIYQDTVDGQFSKSVFAKAGTASFISIGTGTAAASNAVFNLSNGTVSSSVACTATIVSVGGGWYRCCIYDGAATTFFVVNVGTSAANAVPQQSWLGAGETVYLWQVQSILGNHPAGGPIIVTGAATASTGADSFAFTFPNGTYAVTYTFADNTTDVVPALVIAGGTFTIPTTYSKAIKLVTIPV